MDEGGTHNTEEPCGVVLRDVECGGRVLLRRGDHSRVYRVHCAARGIWLGLKEEECIKPLAIVRAVAAIRRLRSEYLLRHYDVRVEGDRTVVTLTELMDCSLSDMRRRHSRLTEPQTKAVAFLVLHALEDLHSRLSMVHADVSPSNILLKTTGELKLGDFASAVRVDEAVEYFAGTVFYTPVEVLRDRQLASRPASDIWALGVTLYECASGDHPFVVPCNNDFWFFLLAMEEAKKSGKHPQNVPHTSDEFYDFFTSVLRWDPALRPTARSLLHHTWFSQFSVVAAHNELRLMAD
ncbi:protein kinase [Trypanosoma grayi]|uniref:protein kinase n=1 Tax=Trypanosoma grayi TaxID=71804 RepID=UPI0004F42047|nr:protein kinase [Trypanosoma grayi]KEG08861.1 protein kinase [Trypanosoma grayi]